MSIPSFKDLEELITPEGSLANSSRVNLFFFLVLPECTTKPLLIFSACFIVPENVIAFAKV